MSSNTKPTKTREAQLKRRPYTPEEIEANKYIYDQHFDIRMVKAMNDEMFFLMEDYYFRPEFIGFDEMPDRNNPNAPIILASNHSGMAFPWDAMVFGCGMYRKHDYDPHKLFRVLTSPMLSQAPLMHPYFMHHAWKMAGGIDASFLNFETMMEYPEGHLLIYPEGVPGIGKGFNRRYKLQRFASSFIRMSLKHKTDILWFSTVNAEFVAPLMYSHKGTNKLFNKLGIPFMPLGPLTLMLIFPFAYYLSFPANMIFVKGRRIKPYEWTDKPYDDVNEDEILEMRDRVHAACQEDLDAAVAQYGQHPYKLGNLLKVLFRKFPNNTPLGWPFLFHEFERQWHKHGKHGRPVKVYKGWGSVFLHIFRNPITLAYFLPIFGWIILVIYGNRKWKKGKRRH
jgi:hypothetical protein